MSIEQIVFAAVGVILLAAAGYSLFTKKDYGRYYYILRPILRSLFAVIQTSTAVLPTAELKTIERIASAAVEATETAENLWRLGSISKEERNAHAMKYITDVLAHSGIAVTEEVRRIVQGVISVVCMFLPHSPVKAKSDI